MKPNGSLLELLMELQILDRLPRMGFVLRGVSDPESVAEHSFHVALLVWALAPRIPEIDTGKALELALLHDVAEVRIGDLPMTAGRYFPDGVKHAAEEAALLELMAPLGERAGRLAAELADRSTAEARLVKACDKLQLMLKVAVYEHWGAGGLAEFWDNDGNFPDSEFEPVRELFEALRRWSRRRTSAADRA
jgi:putative hydrolase of HD superfamily